MKVYFKANGDVLTMTVDSIYIKNHTNEIVLHFSNEYDIVELFELSNKYKLNLYKYVDDGHIGITIPINSVFCMEY